ncbi:AEC family transporter [Gallicola sp. Sow4_E12]|uniref:AEC family transporter n=1 Tax=Gallicola sp. Sow4_E12 TaxID=3438785 RepID=UPI003F9141D4
MTPLMETMLILFIMMVIGFAANKAKFITANTNNEISNLVVNITTPALIIASVLGEETKNIQLNVFYLLLTGIIFYAGMILFGNLFIRIFPFFKEDGTIYKFMLIFGNVGYMGYPIFRSLFGESAVFISVLINMPFNILMFSYGVYSFAKAGGKTSSFHWKNLLSPGLVSAVMALVLYFIPMNVPEFIRSPLASIGNATVPLSMILIGFSLGEIEMKNALKDYKTVIISLVKLIAIPTAVFFIAGLFVEDPKLIELLTINAGLPAASLIVILATQYKVDLEVSTIGVFVSTILSIVTIPMLEQILF